MKAHVVNEFVSLVSQCTHRIVHGDLVQTVTYKDCVPAGRSGAIFEEWKKSTAQQKAICNFDILLVI